MGRLRPWPLIILCLMSLEAFSLDAEALQTTALETEADQPTAEGDQCTTQLHKVVIEQKKKQRKSLEPLEGKPIKSINIRNRPIFDVDNPDEDYAIYRLANKLQTPTKEHVIRNQLLVEEGDVFHLELIEETLRLLRDREYILDVEMSVAELCSGELALVLTVRDAWVIEPKLSYDRKGGEDSSGIGFRNGNFLGTGNEVAVVYERDSERSRMEYRLATARLFNQNLEFEIYHADLSDGSDRRIRLTRPFYAFQTKYAYNLETSKTTIEERIRFNDEEINRYLHAEKKDAVDFGSAIYTSQTSAYRLQSGLARESDNFTELERTVEIPENETREYIWLGLQRVTNIFEQYTNLDYIARKQDLEVGTHWSVKLGYGRNLADEDLYIFESDMNTVFDFTDNHLFRFGAYLELEEVDRKLTEKPGTSSKSGFSTNYYYFIDGKNRWYAKLKYDYGQNLEEHEQFTMGELSGLRGYPIAYQRGDQRYALNIERRFYSDAHWFNLIRVGAVAFIDAGHAWGDNAYKDPSHLASTGFGLRMHSSKSGSPMVMHLNISMPLVKDPRQDDYLVSFSMENRF